MQVAVFPMLHPSSNPLIYFPSLSAVVLSLFAPFNASQDREIQCSFHPSSLTSAIASVKALCLP